MHYGIDSGPIPSTSRLNTRAGECPSSTRKSRIPTLSRSVREEVSPLTPEQYADWFLEPWLDELYIDLGGEG